MLFNQGDLITNVAFQDTIHLVVQEVWGTYLYDSLFPAPPLLPSPISGFSLYVAFAWNGVPVSYVVNLTPSLGLLPIKGDE